MLHFIVQKTPALKGTVHPLSIHHYINKGSGHILWSIKRFFFSFSEFHRVKEFHPVPKQRPQGSTEEKKEHDSNTADPARSEFMLNSPASLNATGA